MRHFAQYLIALVFATTVLAWQPIQTGVVQAQRVNIFDMKKDKDAPPKQKRRGVDSERVRKMTQSFQKELNPDQESIARTFIFYGVLFVSLAIIISGIIYWKMRWQKLKARETDDPMVLVQELIDAHRLSTDEKKVMQTVTAEESLPTSLPLFVEPKFLLTAIDKSTFRESRPVLRSLLTKLFDIEIESDGNTTIMAPGESSIMTAIVEPRI
jgi:hypothetical protein